VGHNFRRAQSRAQLELLASQPSAHFVTVLDSFQRLRGLFQDLQARIYAIEGTSAQHSFHLELSSAGISVAAISGRVLTGAVGADSWAGGVLLIHPPPETFVGNPEVGEDAADAYLGYALAGVPAEGRLLLAVGAPRRGHVGGVELLEGGAGGWARLQSLRGKQDRLRPSVELHGAAGQPLGRFGAALSALGDADGDGEPEVAVGAPMEDDGRGALYIFRGVHQPQYAQRLESRSMGWELRQFGVALDGTEDLNGTDCRTSPWGRTDGWPYEFSAGGVAVGSAVAVG
ncbi:integrin alpha-L-like, partial [Gallus gallus]|uniref:integrin alpha-L-like n=1 Tax=Gallus gallus TaxID=9031 RepID=UPI001AEB26FC